MAVQVACIAHFQHVPLTQLAPATMSSAKPDELVTLIGQIPEAQVPHLKQQVLKGCQPEVY